MVVVRSQRVSSACHKIPAYVDPHATPSMSLRGVTLQTSLSTSTDDRNIDIDKRGGSSPSRRGSPESTQSELVRNDNSKCSRSSQSASDPWSRHQRTRTTSIAPASSLTRSLSAPSRRPPRIPSFGLPDGAPFSNLVPVAPTPQRRPHTSPDVQWARERRLTESSSPIRPLVVNSGQPRKIADPSKPKRRLDDESRSTDAVEGTRGGDGGSSARRISISTKACPRDCPPPSHGGKRSCSDPKQQSDKSSTTSTPQLRQSLVKLKHSTTRLRNAFRSSKAALTCQDRPPPLPSLEQPLSTVPIRKKEDLRPRTLKRSQTRNHARASQDVAPVPILPATSPNTKR